MIKSTFAKEKEQEIEVPCCFHFFAEAKAKREKTRRKTRNDADQFFFQSQVTGAGQVVYGLNLKRPRQNVPQFTWKKKKKKKAKEATIFK